MLVKDYLYFCNDIGNLFQEVGIGHEPNAWQFILKYQKHSSAQWKYASIHTKWARYVYTKISNFLWKLQKGTNGRSLDLIMIRFLKNTPRINIVLFFLPGESYFNIITQYTGRDTFISGTQNAKCHPMVESDIFPLCLHCISCQTVRETTEQRGRCFQIYLHKTCFHVRQMETLTKVFSPKVRMVLQSLESEKQSEKKKINAWRLFGVVF